MRSIRCERLRRWGAGALVLLLLHGLGLARSASAGCSHLVSSHSDRHRGFDQLDALITHGSTAGLSDILAEERAEPQGPKHPRPCSGPGCSSRVPMPVPTASQGSNSSTQWVVLNDRVRPAVASPPDRTVEEPAARATGQEPSIFHPPPA